MQGRQREEGICWSIMAQGSDLDQNHSASKACLTFLFPVKEKGARGIIGGRRKRGQEEGLASEHGWQRAPCVNPGSKQSAFGASESHLKEHSP